MDLWVKGSVIGSGGFGTVRHYYNKENGVERAVKEIQLTDHTPEKVRFNKNFSLFQFLDTLRPDSSIVKY